MRVKTIKENWHNIILDNDNTNIIIILDNDNTNIIIVIIYIIAKMTIMVINE